MRNGCSGKHLNLSFFKQNGRPSGTTRVWSSYNSPLKWRLWGAKVTVSGGCRILNFLHASASGYGLIRRSYRVSCGRRGFGSGSTGRRYSTPAKIFHNCRAVVAQISGSFNCAMSTAHSCCESGGLKTLPANCRRWSTPNSSSTAIYG